MKLHIYCVHDDKTQQFGTPMFLISAGQAIRSFADEINRADKENQIYMHPTDFDLYELGTFDTETAIFDTQTARKIATGKDLRIKTEQQQHLKLQHTN